MQEQLSKIVACPTDKHTSLPRHVLSWVISGGKGAPRSTGQGKLACHRADLRPGTVLITWHTVWSPYDNAGETGREGLAQPLKKVQHNH